MLAIEELFDTRFDTAPDDAGCESCHRFGGSARPSWFGGCDNNPRGSHVECLCERVFDLDTVDFH
jgi:hypothetical protein